MAGVTASTAAGWESGQRPPGSAAGQPAHHRDLLGRLDDQPVAAADRAAVQLCTTEVLPAAQAGQQIVQPGPDHRGVRGATVLGLSLIHISEPTRRTPSSYAVFCLSKQY